MSLKVHALLIMRVTVFPCRSINLVQQMTQRRVIRLLWIEWLVQIFFAWYQLSEKRVQLLHRLLIYFFFSRFPHLFAERWTSRVPKLSHWLFRLSVALFGLHNVSELQQGFPLPNSLRNVYLHTHQSTRLMGISCKCSAVCILRCKLKNTEVQGCDIKVIHQTLSMSKKTRLNLKILSGH